MEGIPDDARAVLRIDPRPIDYCEIEFPVLWFEITVRMERYRIRDGAVLRARRPPLLWFSTRGRPFVYRVFMRRTGVVGAGGESVEVKGWRRWRSR